MVARLTPDQKVACSILVGFKILNNNPVALKYIIALLFKLNITLC
jgi:hypothetical protein